MFIQTNMHSITLSLHYVHYDERDHSTRVTHDCSRVRNAVEYPLFCIPTNMYSIQLALHDVHDDERERYKCGKLTFVVARVTKWSERYFHPEEHVFHSAFVPSRNMTTNASYPRWVPTFLTGMPELRGEVMPWLSRKNVMDFGGKRSFNSFLDVLLHLAPGIPGK